MLLNYLRWSNELIIWKHLLLLLEGELVKLAAPKILFGKYVYIKSDIPIFATSKCIINFHGLYNTTNDMEDKVMKVK